MKSGFFVTFEGIEGCGKTTQMHLVSDWLKERGVDVCSTRQPGGTPIGSEIRRILLSEKTVALTPVAEAMLYLADRFQHIEQVIRPALAAGKLVLCDRYHDSTVAYQGYARRIPLSVLDAVWKQSGLALEPHLTLLFDIDPETGIRRSLQKLQQQNMDESRFEKEAIDFHKKVRTGFLELAKGHPDRFVVLDGTFSIEEIHSQVKTILEERLRNAIV